MKTALLVSLLLTAFLGPGPAVQTGPEAEPPAASETIAFDPLAEAVNASHCNVSYTQCSSGGSISCTGHSYCTSGTGWVECDGVRTYCPPSSCFNTCMDGVTFCYSETGDCGGSGLNWISCDGVRYECGPPQN
jgi:hypothetical protein